MEPPPGFQLQKDKRGQATIRIQVDEAGKIAVNDVGVPAATEEDRKAPPYRITAHADRGVPFIHSLGRYKITRLELERQSEYRDE